MAGGSIASLFVEIGAKTEGLQSGLKSAESGVSGFASKIGGLAGAAATGFGFAIAAPIIGGLGGVFGSVTEGVMGTNNALQQSGVAWGVLLGGADQAQQKISELYAFGASTPFEFGEVDKASRVLQTFGGNALNTTANLTMIGDVAMWTARMYDAFKSGQPFGEAAARLQEMGAMSGETRLKLEEMQKAGASQEELWAVLSGSFGKYSGMMDQQSKTFSGMLSTMKDSLNQLLSTAGKPIFDLVTAGLTKVVGIMGSPGFIDGAKNFATNLAGWLANAGTAIGNFIGKVISIGSSFGDIIGSLKNGNFQGVFLGIMDVIGKVFGLDSMAPVASFVGQALSFLYNLKDGAVAAFHMIADFVGGTLIPAIQAFIPVAVAAFQGVAQWVTGTFLPALGQVKDALLGAFNTAMPVIQNFASAVLPQISAAFQAILPYIQQYGQYLFMPIAAFALYQAFTANVLPALQTGFAAVSGAVQAVVPYVQRFIDTLQSGVSAVLPALQQFGQLIGSAVGGALQAIIPLVQGFVSVFQSNLPSIIALGGQLRGVWEQVQGALVALAPVGKLLAEVLGGLIVGAIGILMGTLGGLVGMFTGILPGAIQIVSGSITVIQGVLQTFTAIVTGVVDIVTNLIHGNWSGAWEAAKTMVQGAASGISTMISGLGTMLEGLFNTMIGAITGYVSGFVTTILGFFSGLVTQLTGNTTDLSSAITSAWQSLTSGVANTVQSWIAEIQNKFASLKAQAINHAHDLATGVQNAFDNLVSGVQTAISMFVSTVTNGITGLIGTAASNAASVGSAIISGIVGAIQAGAGAIESAIAGVVGNVIDKAKSLLGINSPSKVFAAFGSGIIEGFVKGIDDNASDGVSSVSNAMKAAIGAGDGLALKVNLGGLSARVGDTSSRDGYNGARAVTINLNVGGSVIAQDDLKELALQAYYEAGRQGRL